MKKTYLVATAILILSAAFSLSHAQQRFDAKLFAGLNLCQVDGDDDGSYNHPGLRTGVGTSFTLGENGSPWRMLVELAYAQKGSHINNSNGDIALQYVELPLMLSYSLADNRLRLAAGVAPAVLVGVRVTFGGTDSPEQAAKYKRMDWLPLTALVSYRFTDHLAAEARYQNSLLSVYDGAGPYRLWTSNHGAFNRLLTLGLAYQF